MNLAEEFKRLREEWERTGAGPEAPRARHRFAVFCLDNAEAIELALKGWAYAKVGEVTLHMPIDPEERAKIEALFKEHARAPLQVIDKDALPLEPSDRAVEEAMHGYRARFQSKMPDRNVQFYFDCMKAGLTRAYAFDAGRLEPDPRAIFCVDEAVGEAVREETNNRAKPFDIEAERPAFEKWATEEHGGMMPLDRAIGIGYVHKLIQAAWLGWCSHAKLAPAAEKEPEFDRDRFSRAIREAFGGVVQWGSPLIVTTITLPRLTEDYEWRACAHMCSATLPTSIAWSLCRDRS